MWTECKNLGFVAQFSALRPARRARRSVRRPPRQGGPAPPRRPCSPLPIRNSPAALPRSSNVSSPPSSTSAPGTAARIPGLPDDRLRARTRLLLRPASGRPPPNPQRRGAHRPLRAAALRALHPSLGRSRCRETRPPRLHDRRIRQTRDHPTTSAPNTPPRPTPCRSPGGTNPAPRAPNPPAWLAARPPIPTSPRSVPHPTRRRPEPAGRRPPGCSSPEPGARLSQSSGSGPTSTALRNVVLVYPGSP